MSLGSLDLVLLEISLRLVAALLIGGLIGLERSYHGRPAGFRTHALVCLSTGLLMVITVYERRWFPQVNLARITLDPTRMAQGIMTGIGFLGAGTIIRDGLSVRGLTTAASIWTTAAIGILVGIGFYAPAVVATLLTLVTLSLFRWIEVRIPTHFYAQFVIRFARQSALSEPDLRKLIGGHGFKISNLHYRLDGADDFFEYKMVLHSARADCARRLSETLTGTDHVKEFRISPSGD